MKNKSSLILVRHGQSIYNEQNRFTGWKDVELTNKGISEAYQAAGLLKDFIFTHAFTSKLIRAQHTLDIILNELDQKIDIEKNISLNERNYGDLVGQNKKEAAEIFGEKQIEIWRRSFDTPPPNGESLKMTADRTIPYFKENIQPLLTGDNTVIVSAHGNSIRSIVMHLHDLSNKQILKTEVGWCEPWVYNYFSGSITDFSILGRPGIESNSSIPQDLQIETSA